MTLGAAPSRPASGDGLVRRLAAWSGDRFPPRYLALLAPHAIAALAWASAGEPLRRPVAPLGLASFGAFFLVLRVVDEHQDAGAADTGGRVLSAGLVSLGELRAVGAAAVAVQLAFAAACDRGVGAVGAATLALLGWGVVAGRELFQDGAWTRRHSVLFALSHLLLAPAAVAWLSLGFARALAGATPPRAGFWPGVAALALAAGLANASFELSRKTCGPADPRASGYTYSAVWGLGAAVRVQQLAAVALAGVVIGFAHLAAPARPTAWRVALDAGVGVAATRTIALAAALRRRPDVEARRRNERAAQLLVAVSAWYLAARLAWGAA